MKRYDLEEMPNYDGFRGLIEDPEGEYVLSHDVEQIIQQRDELAKALEPFAAFDKEYPKHEPDSTCSFRIKKSDLIRCSAALKKARGE